MIEYLYLIWIDFMVTLRRFPEFVKVVFQYYSDFAFCKQDLYMLFSYPRSPFAISKEFLKKRGEDDLYQYGETPLTTLDKIAKECHITNKDILFELGSGRGRGCFWLHHFIGCQVVGIEYIPQFVAQANKIKEKFGLKGIEFREEDFLQTDLKGTTVIYLYGTCLKEKEIVLLIDKFAKLPNGTKIITVSFPLTDYTSKPLFEVMKRFPASFTWGEGDVFLHLKK